MIYKSTWYIAPKMNKCSYSDLQSFTFMQSVSVMDSSNLNFELPSYYHIVSDSKGGSYSEPLSGIAVLTGFTQKELADLHLLKISLVCVLSTKDRGKCISESNLLARFNRWRLTRQSPYPTYSARCCSVIEQMTLHGPFTGGSEVEYKIPFRLPISANIPGTSMTGLGNISYFLVASAKTVNGRSLSDISREINITHQLCPDQYSTQHTCNYSVLNLITKIILTQDIASVTRSKIPVNAKVFVRPARPADRPIEYRCVAIRGIRWRVEESTKVFNQRKCREENLPQCQPIEEQSSTRVISKGLLKGYWKILQCPSGAECSPRNDDPSVEIPLEISIATDIDSPSEVGLGCYLSTFKPTDSSQPIQQEEILSTTQKNMMITIEHRLKLDILTSEDTFCVHRHILVDRKPLQTALGASFPLWIIDRAKEDVKDILNEAMPPRYEEVSISPPDYNNST